MEIKVGICVSYDWHFLNNSIPLIYTHADRICLSIDKNRTGWSGKKYSFDEAAFRSFLADIDKDRKLELYEDNFFDPSLSAMENDNRQRRMMSEYLGEGGWHIQIDSDEYFLNFKDFVGYLRKIKPSILEPNKPFNVCCPMISVFKRLDQGYLVIDNSKADWEVVAVATKHPEYLYARKNSHFNIICPFFLLHETWSRERSELVQKLDSWGHIHDFDKVSYLKLWDAVDRNNCHYVQDFHPIQPAVWNRLKYFEADSPTELISQVGGNRGYVIDPRSLYLRNSRTWNRILAVLKRF